MTELDPDGLLEEVRGLAAAAALIDRALPLAVKRAHEAGIDSVRLAGALGVHRSTLYRRYMPPRPSRSEAEARQV